GIMDFSDLEHLCLALLVEPGTEDDPQPSDVAKELQDTFKEIMVDEYQDTNGVQETIINLISRVDNRFYVGDVKQAIYSFRMADSSLFMEKYNILYLWSNTIPTAVLMR
ncbi:MAG: ATP-dependent helicase/nuclease subunit A, partial [Veillonella sp. DORA_A_3_16_22]